MGCLVDTFIITPKRHWMHRTDCPDEKDLRKIINAVPFKYRMMLRALMIRFTSLDVIMENRDTGHAGEVMQTAEPFETDDVCFEHRYRGECLQQIIRMRFYRTLLILENDINPEKYNYFIVCSSDQVICEDQWHRHLPHEQVFINAVFGNTSLAGSTTAHSH